MHSLIHPQPALDPSSPISSPSFAFLPSTSLPSPPPAYISKSLIILFTRSMTMTTVTTAMWGMDNEAGQMACRWQQQGPYPTQSKCIRYIQYNFILFYYICLIYGKPTINGGTIWSYRDVQLCGALHYWEPFFRSCSLCHTLTLASC